MVTQGGEREGAADSELVRRLSIRDQEALVELYRRYGRRVYPLILRIVRSQSVADEVVQDVFLRLWTRPERYSPEAGSLLAWLLTVGRNLALDALRREHRWRRDLDLDDEVRWAAVDCATDVSLVVQDGLAALPEDQRTAIELAYFSGMTHAEMAAHLEEPLGTVKSRLRLALDKLRRALGRDLRVMR